MSSVKCSCKKRPELRLVILLAQEARFEGVGGGGARKGFGLRMRCARIDCCVCSLEILELGGAQRRTMDASWKTRQAALSKGVLCVVRQTIAGVWYGGRSAGTLNT